MKRPAITLALLTLASAAHAATPHVTFEWALPDRRVDGRALAAMVALVQKRNALMTASEVATKERNRGLV